MKSYDNFENVLEYRDIKVTSKRQFTIPKTFFDTLKIDDTLQAFLLKDGIFLKPIQKTESIYELDIQNIIRKVREEGYSGEELDKEIAHRIAQYNRVIDRRVQGFLDDLEGGSASEEEEVDYNGLDIFFDQEDGETSEGSSKEE